MNRHDYLRPGEPLLAPRITRTRCAFEGCPMPHAVTPMSSDPLCFAHQKQRQRGGPLRPFKPRSDPAKAWERWRKLRERARTNCLGLRCPFCDGLVRVGKRVRTDKDGAECGMKAGERYARCPTCEARLIFDRKKRFDRATREPSR